MDAPADITYAPLSGRHNSGLSPPLEDLLIENFGTDGRQACHTTLHIVPMVVAPVMLPYNLLVSIILENLEIFGNAL